MNKQYFNMNLNKNKRCISKWSNYVKNKIFLSLLKCKFDTSLTISISTVNWYNHSYIPLNNFVVECLIDNEKPCL